MNLIIRVDSSEEIGTGHIVRCLALAEGLRANGAEVSFICRDLSGNISHLVERNGFFVHRLSGGADIANRQDFDDLEAIDAEQTMAALIKCNTSADWLIVDHYSISEVWERSLREIVPRVAVIDDLANRKHACDLLLDQNLYFNPAERYREIVPDECIVLCGPKYALLRPEFSQARAKLHTRDGRIRRILVFFGGTDPTNETVKALNGISLVQDPTFSIDVVVGGTNRSREMIRERCSALPNCSLHLQATNMAELMSRADLCIGAGGTTTWERCSLGLPSIIVSVAPNQVPNAISMAAEGALLYLGDCKEVSARSIARVLQGLMEVPKWLVQLSVRSARLVDGRGVERAIRHLMAPTIHLRLAQAEDCESVFKWRNAEENRRYSCDAHTLSYADHKHWYCKTIADANRVLLIGEVQGQPVGVIRYDLDRCCARISIYLVPGQCGKGIGNQLLRFGREWLRLNRPKVSELVADILVENKASLDAFTAAGFRPVSSTYRYAIKAHSSA